MESTIDFEKKEGHIDDHSKSDSAGSSIPAFSRQAHCRRRNPICRVSRQDACSGREGAHHRLAAVEFVLDNTPFMNMLYVLEGERGNGRGRQLVSHWEALMKAKGYPLVMTSTQSDETAQHFYRKLGYVDAGALLLQDEPLEIILTKALR